MLTLMNSASIIFANSLLGKAYMSFGWRAAGPKGEPGNPAFENAHRAQLNEAEWSPLLIAGLLCLRAKGETAPIAATIAAAGSVGYLWVRCLLRAENGTPLVVLSGGLARYIAGFMMAYRLLM